ncbi:DUF300-domain-containing protein [Dendrothele bispora CBS 962.96]|uniref:DUF300-domain-containing protein n=1 Tax=Dendrothele bispora (strain CBS 962.96) TaxID=1314807 RepID=A0A4S8MZ07_DENBC|nr:DUF300-domain-containing protein [Dendrothele bispora CBS 962.96]
MSNHTEESTSSSRCFKHEAQDGPSLFQDGNLVFQAHHVGWIVSSFFTIVAIIASFWLINKHLQWYTDKREQRYIVRILFMVPIYALISLASYFFWNHSTPLLLIRDCYESTVLTSFFYLLLNYLSHDTDEQRAIFLKEGLSREADRIALKKGEKPRKWMFPLGFIKAKPADGLYFLQLMKWGVLQYCVIRPLTTLAAVILDYAGLYCEDSWGLGWGHVYITVIVSISVTIAMYCLLQLYFPVSSYLTHTKPLLKLFAIKAVVFLTFWQATFLSVLTMFGIVKDTQYMTADDINIGIGALLETFEMMLFGFLHIRAFTYRVYKPAYDPKSKDDLPPLRTPRWRSLLHAMNFRETFVELKIGCVYLWEKVRGREPTADREARRFAHYESAFDKPRASGMGNVVVKGASKDKEEKEKEKDRRGRGVEDDRDGRRGLLPEIEIEREEYVDISGTRQWLGYGNNYGYGIKREPSEGLGMQIEKELEKRGYGSHIPGRGHIKPYPVDDGVGHTHQPQRSWWRSLYERISQTGDGDDIEDRLTSNPSTRKSGKRASRSRSKQHRPSRSRSRRNTREVDADRGLLHDYHYEDPPPPSLMMKNRQNQIREYYDPHRYSGLPGRMPRREDVSSPPPSSYPDNPSLYQTQQSPPPFQKQPYRHGSPGSPARPNVLSHPPARGLERDRRFPASPPPSSPPPPSLLPPSFNAGRSKDSLLDRVFPPSNVSHIDIVTDSTHAGLGRYGPLGQPKTHSPTTPTSEYGHGIGMAGERVFQQYHNPGETPSSAHVDLSEGLSAQVVHLGNDEPPLRFPTPPSTNVDVSVEYARRNSNSNYNSTPMSHRYDSDTSNSTTRHDNNVHDDYTAHANLSAPASGSSPNRPTTSQALLVTSYPTSSPSQSASSPRSPPQSPRHSSGGGGGLRRSSAIRNEPPRGDPPRSPQSLLSRAQASGMQTQLMQLPEVPSQSHRHSSRRHSVQQQVQVPQHTYMPHPQDRRRSVPVKLTMPAPLAPRDQQQHQQGQQGYDAQPSGRG